MKTILLLACLFVAGLSACAVNPVKAAHLTTHHTTTTTLFGTSGCSATAIGPHALLTASHCEAPVDVVTVDEIEYKIVGTPIRDGFDHSIYILTGTAFKDYAVIATDEVDVADDLFIFGNPADMEDQFRRGYITSVSEEMFTIDVNGFFGDSGAALFNTKGQIIGVVSALRQRMQGTAGIKFMISYKLSFTKDQLKIALESK